MAAYLLVVFLFGTIVGSFLNVVILRLHAGRSFVGGRSACMSCLHELSAGDMIPVLSFVFLRAHCRYCRAKLSWQYPLVEFLTGLVFALGGYRFGLSPMLGFFIVASGFFIVIAVYDYKHLLILDKVVLPGAILAFLFNLGLDLTGSCQAAASAWWRSCTVSGIEGALLIAGFFFLQHMLSKGRWIGFGDVKLGLLLGLAVGFAGSLVLLFIAYLLGAITGLGLIAAGRKHLSSRLPFGTFLSVSAIITLLYGEPILDWYLTLIGFR